jgi:hypothetical protein
LLSTQLENNLIKEIEGYIVNDYLETVPHEKIRKKIERRSSVSSGENKSFGSQVSLIHELRIRDQKKLESYVENGNKLNESRSLGLGDSIIDDFEKSLSVDYDLNRRRDRIGNRINGKTQHSDVHSTTTQRFDTYNGYFNDDNDESMLVPSVDLKYRAHNVLPFNLHS